MVTQNVRLQNVKLCSRFLANCELLKVWHKKMQFHRSQVDKANTVHTVTLVEMAGEVDSYITLQLQVKKSLQGVETTKHSQGKLHSREQHY